MRFIYIDAVGGASGDMLLGAFLDGLVPFDYLEQELAKLNLKDYQLKLENTQRHHISAKKFTVIYHEHIHRHFSDIEKIIQKSELNSSIKEKSIKVFRRLGEEEARIHQIPLEKVHFHEVGAMDSIIDIVGALICLDYLQPEKIFSSPLPLSQGIVKAAHGKLPVPAPATMALLKNYPVVYRPIQGEMVTPTGAALITTISDGLLPVQQTFKILATGYGAGNKDWEEVPNLLRIWIGEFSSKHEYDAVYQIETNIDDMNPEIYPYLQEKLFKTGAMDVSFYTTIMKKGRPGILISILADADKIDDIRNILYEETSTIGFRYFPVYREKLKRKLKIVDSPWGKIQVKEVIWQEKKHFLPEYEECRRIAEKTGQPLKDIYRKIQELLAQAYET